MLRGINRQAIFECEEDYERFIAIVSEAKELSDFKIYGYCLMGNHVHLLVCTEDEELGTIMKRIGVRYASWFNRKYARVGALFQDRYKSEAVEDERYLLGVLRYIHHNPVKARIVRRARDYTWSSFGDYLGSGGGGITDVDETLPLFSSIPARQKDAFIEFMEADTGEAFLDLDTGTDEALKEWVRRACGTKTATEFQALSKADRDRNIRLLRETGLSIRQIVRLTGIPFGVVRSK
jgi:REP element-mobilizing transposase RayT